MEFAPLPASKGAINRAGEALRAAAQGDQIDDEVRSDALALVRAYRASHAYPLTKVRSRLVYHATKAADGSWYDLGQRLKQQATIIDKLVRMPKSNLARMQDIGGCRVVFVDQATVDRAIESIATRSRKSGGKQWDIVDVDDYVSARTRRDGYRAKHVIVREMGLQIEIQFRTVVQHNWAGLVEELDKATNLGLKTGRAEEWALQSVAAAADDMRRYEIGDIDRPALVAALNASLKPILDSGPRGGVIR